MKGAGFLAAVLSLVAALFLGTGKNTLPVGATAAPIEIPGVGAVTSCAPCAAVQRKLASRIR